MVNSVRLKLSDDTSPSVTDPSTAGSRDANKCYPVPKDVVIIPMGLRSPMGFSSFAGNTPVMPPGLQGPVGVGVINGPTSHGLLHISHPQSRSWVSGDICFEHKDGRIVTAYKSNRGGGGDPTRSTSPSACNPNIFSPGNDINGPTPHAGLPISRADTRHVPRGAASMSLEQESRSPAIGVVTAASRSDRQQSRT